MGPATLLPASDSIVRVSPTRPEILQTLRSGKICSVAPGAARSFDVVRYEEATIADIHGALSAKTLTCRALVQMYLERIAAYDKKGPALNAIVVTNPDALKLADTLDARFVQSGPIGPLLQSPPAVLFLAV